MKNILLIGLSFFILVGNLEGQTNANATSSSPAKSIAVTIVYDGSGSMRETVRGSDGQQTPKFVIANRAVNSIIHQLLAFGQAKQIDVRAGLVLFVNSSIKQTIPLAPLTPAQGEVFTNWAAGFKSPGGGTPLGMAIEEAERQLAASDAAHKHILVITDGVSNVGVAPAKVVHDLHESAAPMPVYFVAFDISASVFDPVKKAGATVVSASDEAQLNTQINAILGQKILLEAE